MHFILERRNIGMAAASALQVPNTRQALSLELLRHVPEQITLLELVLAVSALSDEDQVVVDTVVRVLESGRVRLRGNFRGEPIELLKA